MGENNIENMEELIGKVLSGNATAAEAEKLQVWKEASALNLKKFNGIQRIWNADQEVFSKIDLDKDREETKGKIMSRLLDRNTSSFYQSLVKIAAVLFIPVVLGSGWLLFDKLSNTADAGFMQITSNQSRISECVLEDGTKVWLNANSSLKLQSNFSSNTREVNLIGEAFFEVAENPQKPFIVHTSHMDIKVLGTSFNVQAFPDRNYIKTTLETGKVSLKYRGEGVAKEMQMVPGQQSRFDKTNKEISLNDVDVSTYSAWRYGMFVFKDESLENIAKEIERLYDVHIRFEDETIKQMRFRGMFEQDKTIFNALDKFQKTTNIAYKVNNKEITLYMEENAN